MTNVLHLGGEFSSGTITKADNWIIADINAFKPVALVKSGPSTLDLSQGNANTYSGGTSILGGTIEVSDAGQLGSGPIFLSNAGTLHVASLAAVTFNQTLKLFGGPTSGAGIIKVDPNITATFDGTIDTTTFISATAAGTGPQSLIENHGGGTLAFTPNFAYPNNAQYVNRWGLSLYNGTVEINQLPVNLFDADGAKTGALVGNGDVNKGGATLSVLAVPAGSNVPVNDPRYGFSSLATYQGTTTTVNVADGALLRINGSVASTMNGTLVISNYATGVVEIASATPGLDATGNGMIDMGTGTLRLTQLSAAANASKLLPQSTGFTLKLNHGTFISNVDGSINGNLIINDEIPGSSVIESVGTPLSPNPLWVVAGSGLTAWNGTLVKELPGTIELNRCAGAPVTVASGANLLINGGTFVAGGTGDPFTDSTTNLSIDVVNNSTASGFVILAGNKKVDNITGSGDTYVVNGSTLTAASIVQDSLTIGGAAPAFAAPMAVPEPSAFALLGIALVAVGLFARCGRKQ